MLTVLQRLLHVVFFVLVGLFLIVVPWWPALWERNYFTFLWPSIEPVLSNNFVRGGVSGLGVVNLFAGFVDLALLFASRDAIESSADSATRS